MKWPAPFMTRLGAAAFSSLLYLLMWDGAWQHLDNKGGVGLLLNLAVLAASLWWTGI